MIPKHNDGSAYDHWARGGGSVKARSRIQQYVTVLKYSTYQSLQVIQDVWFLNTSQVLY